MGLNVKLAAYNNYMDAGLMNAKYDSTHYDETCAYQRDDGKTNCFDCLAKGPVCYYEDTEPVEVNDIMVKGSRKTGVCDNSGFYTEVSGVGGFPGRTIHFQDCPKSDCESAEILSKCSQCTVCEEANCE